MNTTTRLGLLSVFLLVAACEVSTSPGGDDVPPGGGPVVPGPGQGEDDPALPDDDEPSCAAPTNGPTIHTGGDVADGEVWTADGSPHIVEWDVRVRAGATLTIEPCAEVLIAKGKHITVAFPGTPNTGTLVAEGTAKRPITIRGKDGERWASLMVRAPGTARLAHVRFLDGGGGDFEEGSTLNVVGDSVDGADPIVKVDHVTIEGSLGTGAWVHAGATFLPGSRDLVVKGSGSYPITISEHALDALPTGTFTGNAKDEIFLDPEGGQTAGSGLLTDATVHDRGVPYHVGRSKGESLIIGGRPDGKLVTMTIEPGVVMRFVEGGALKVQHFTNQLPSTAALRAVGLPGKPIVFTSAKDAPAPGDWQGIWFGGVPQASNAIEHARIEYAGGDCGCILSTCSAIAQHEGSIIFTAEPPSAFVRNTTIANGAGHGITQGFVGGFLDFKSDNTFEGISGCEQTRPQEPVCPTPKPACD